MGALLTACLSGSAIVPARPSREARGARARHRLPEQHLGTDRVEGAVFRETPFGEARLVCSRLHLQDKVEGKSCESRPHLCQGQRRQHGRELEPRRRLHCLAQAATHHP